MNRHFSLKEVTYDEFINVCEKAGVPQFKFYDNTKYSVMLNTVNYPNLQHLLTGIEDNFQGFRCVWYPGSMPLKEAKKKIFNERMVYFQALIENEGLHDKILIELLQRHLRQGSWFSHDQFEFQKETGWVLRHFRIANKNLRIYTLSGLSIDYKNTRAVLGVHPNPVGKQSD